MTQIDPARLARVLASIRELQGPAKAAKPVVEPSAPGQRRSARDPAVLRARLRERLLKIDRSSPEFASASPVITVQEVLRWEFGDTVLEHPQFDQVVRRVAQSLLSDTQTEASIRRVVDNLLS